jgi:two-component system, sporulation sensor kinase E
VYKFFNEEIEVMIELSEVKEIGELLAVLMDTLNDFVCIKDGESRWLATNAFGIRLFHLEDVAYRGKSDKDLAELKPFFKDAFLECFDSDERAWGEVGGIRVEEFIETDDGVKTFDVMKVPTFNGDGTRKALVTIGRDITDRKIMEEKLRESEERYRRLVESSPDMIAAVSSDDDLLYINNAGIQLIGITNFLEIKGNGSKISDYLKDANTIIAHQGSTNFCEREFKTIDGSILDVEVAVTPIVYKGTAAKQIVVRDITKRKRTEGLLRKSEKMAALGELAAGVAHEIRNPLTALKGFTQILKPSLEKKGYYLDIMEAELERIESITSELLILAKPQIQIFNTTKIETIVQHVADLLEPEMQKKQIKVNLNFLHGEATIDGDENQLKQAFINIVKNAIDSMDQGEINIKTIIQNDQLAVIIQDQGSGISEGRLSKLGEPFYSTKEKGTGLGLMITFKIVKEHRGEIKFDSIIGEGTTVSVSFPIS